MLYWIFSSFVYSLFSFLFSLLQNVHLSSYVYLALFRPNSSFTSLDCKIKRPTVDGILEVSRHTVYTGIRSESAFSRSNSSLWRLFDFFLSPSLSFFLFSEIIILVPTPLSHSLLFFLLLSTIYIHVPLLLLLFEICHLFIFSNFFVPFNFIWSYIFVFENILHYVLFFPNLRVD